MPLKGEGVFHSFPSAHSHWSGCEHSGQYFGVSRGTSWKELRLLTLQEPSLWTAYTWPIRWERNTATALDLFHQPNLKRAKTRQRRDRDRDRERRWIEICTGKLGAWRRQDRRSPVCLLPRPAAEEASPLWAQPAPWEEVQKPNLETQIDKLELRRNAGVRFWSREVWQASVLFCVWRQLLVPMGSEHVHTWRWPYHQGPSPPELSTVHFFFLDWNAGHVGSVIHTKMRFLSCALAFEILICIKLVKEN